jgi:hypothetical protein
MITVIEAAALDLVDTETAALALGIDDDDVQLPAQIAAASALVQAYTGREFNVASVAEQFTDMDSAILMVSRFPIVEVESISEDGETLTVDDWEADNTSGILYRLRNDRRSGWCASSIVITYDCGFEDVPQAVQAACIDLIRIRRSKASRDPLLRSIDIPEVIAESYWNGAVPGEAGQALPADCRAMLAPYVIRRAVAA